MILELVAVFTVWSIYQAARWANIQSMHMASRSARRIKSTRASTLDGQHIMVDR